MSPRVLDVVTLTDNGRGTILFPVREPDTLRASFFHPDSSRRPSRDSFFGLARDDEIRKIIKVANFAREQMHAKGIQDTEMPKPNEKRLVKSMSNRCRFDHHFSLGMQNIARMLGRALRNAKIANSNENANRNRESLKAKSFRRSKLSPRRLHARRQRSTMGSQIWEKIDNGSEVRDTIAYFYVYISSGCFWICYLSICPRHEARRLPYIPIKRARSAANYGTVDLDATTWTCARKPRARSATNRNCDEAINMISNFIVLEIRYSQTSLSPQM